MMVPAAAEALRPENLTDALARDAGIVGTSCPQGSAAPLHAPGWIGNNQGFCYDQNGNRTRDVASGVDRQSTWLLNNRVQQVTQGGTEIAFAIYDNQEQVRYRRDNGVGRFYPAPDYHVVGSDVVTQYHFAGRNVAMRTSGGGPVLWRTLDAQGTPMAAYNASGTLVSWWIADAWGAPVSTAGNFGTSTYTGGIHFPTGGSNGPMVTLGARDHDPRRAAFSSPDPIIPALYNPAALNRYSYTYNNPLRYTDPSGHIAQGTEEERANEIRRDVADTFGVDIHNDWGCRGGWPPFSCNYEPGNWRLEQLYSVRDSLRAIANFIGDLSIARELLQGMTILRQPLASGLAEGAAGTYTRGSSAITLYDEAFQYSPGKHTSQAFRTYVVAHEVGHFLDIHRTNGELGAAYLGTFGDTHTTYGASFPGDERRTRQEAFAEGFAMMVVPEQRLQRGGSSVYGYQIAPDQVSWMRSQLLHRQQFGSIRR